MGINPGLLLRCLYCVLLPSPFRQLSFLSANSDTSYWPCPKHSPLRMYHPTTNQTTSTLWSTRVYDLTKFQDEHPGGKKILQRVAGKDASKQFWKYHNESILKKYKGKLQVGSLDTKKTAAPPTPPATPPPAPVATP